MALACLLAVAAPAALAQQSGRSTKAAPAKADPTDTVSDELNRREAERIERYMRDAQAKATAPAIPPSPVLAPAVPPLPAQGDTVPGQQAQTTPVRPLPSPVPIPLPPAAGTGAPAQPQPPLGAPGRPFGQARVVPTEAPTLTIEVNKGTAVKLPAPASSVFIAAPDIADVQAVSASTVYVFAKKPGDTVLYAVDAQDRVLLNTIVRVTSPLSRVKGALDTTHPNNGITFDNQGESIVVGGTAKNADVVEDARRLALQQVGGNPSKVVGNVRIDAPTQVQLRVKVAEVKRESLKRVGINWQNINSIAMFGTGAVLGGFAVRTINANPVVPPSGALAFQTSDNGLNALIDFLATQGQATILAEPNLIAMSGETASFLAGGEIPIIIPQGGTLVGTMTVQYKQVGVSLGFTPTIIGDRINLKVAPEVSELSPVGAISVPLTSTAVVTVPAIRTRRAATTIELGSGQSFAIAGLLQQTSQQDITKFPWLGDVPVLGTLFKSDAYQRSETELVIIITPYLVEPTSGRLRTPLTDRVPPTDADRLVMQRFNHPTPPRRLTVSSSNGTTTAPSGPVAGFKVD